MAFYVPVKQLQLTILNIEYKNKKYKHSKIKEKSLNVAFDSMPIQFEAEKSTESFKKMLTLGMDSFSNQPEVEVENNNCTLSSVVDSV